MCDDFSGYKASLGSGIIEIGCMAHAPRKYFEQLHDKHKSELAGQALRFIGGLYEIEREVRNAEPARGINAYRYDEELFLAKFSGRDEIMNAVEVERGINAYELHRRGRNYGVALQNARQLPNEYNTLVLKHESNLLNEVYARISVLDDVEKSLH